jgi:hypothetical protein
MQKPGQGFSASLTGFDAQTAETRFSMLGMAIRVVGDGEPSTTCNASAPEDTDDGAAAYARFPPPRPTRYPPGLLPG